jgi:hypothetical protein
LIQVADALAFTSFRLTREYALHPKDMQLAYLEKGDQERNKANTNAGCLSGLAHIDDIHGNNFLSTLPSGRSVVTFVT